MVQVSAAAMNVGTAAPRCGDVHGIEAPRERVEPELERHQVLVTVSSLSPA